MTKDEQTFEAAILSSWNEESPRSYVLFSSPNCAPCDRFKKIIEGLEGELKTVVSYVNAYHAVAAITSSKIRAVPTLVRFEKGQETGRLVGDKSPAVIREFLQN